MAKRLKVFGQDSALKLLRNFASTEKIPPALLFTGPTGVGRRRAAKLFALETNCVNRTACGLCLDCIAVQSGDGHREISIPELFERKGGKVDHLRDELASFRLTHSRRLMLGVIDGADEMNDAMQASVLKAIEEPADRVAFALISENPGRISLTIRSRCVPVRFQSLASGDIEAALEADGTPLDAAAKKLIPLAGGSIESARALIEEYKSPTGVEEAFFKCLNSRGMKRQELLRSLKSIIPVLARRRPEWRDAMLEFDSIASRNGNISLAAAVFNSKIER